MAVTRAKGPKDKADKLFSRLIRRSGACENCDYVCPPACKAWEGIHRTGCKLQCAHLITRHLSATRCEPRNAFSLCAKCHYHFGLWPLDFSEFVLDRRSPEEYASLKHLAQQGTGKKHDWDKTVVRLEQLWTEAGEQWDF